MTLKLLRTCDIVDFNSSIANFWPENRKDKCHSFGPKIWYEHKLQKKTSWGEKIKGYWKEINVKNFSYIFLFILCGYLYSCKYRRFLPREDTTDGTKGTTTISVYNLTTGCTDSGHSPSDCVTWDEQNSCCSSIPNYSLCNMPCPITMPTALYSKDR